MAVSPQGLSIQALYRYYRDGLLVVNRQYQRKLVWTVAEKQNLIDSILKNYPLPLFLLAEKLSLNDGKPIFEIIDGMSDSTLFSATSNMAFSGRISVSTLVSLRGRGKRLRLASLPRSTARFRVWPQRAAPTS